MHEVEESLDGVSADEGNVELCFDSYIDVDLRLGLSLLSAEEGCIATLTVFTLSFCITGVALGLGWCIQIGILGRCCVVGCNWLGFAGPIEFLGNAIV